MKSIWAHTLVKNEERFLWYAIMSVINHVDKILLWDTGSTDKTVDIIHQIKKLYPKKVLFKEVGSVGIEEFTKVRQQMLDKTNSDWILIVDGDEVWWDESIRQVVQKIQLLGDKIESIVVPTINLVGDMYHYQEEAAGNYQLAGRKGHLALRAINRRIPGLLSDKPHGTWGWVDKSGKMIQDRDPGKIVFVNAYYMHMTHLPRSGKRTQDLQVPKRVFKLKHELGDAFPLDYYYPESFFRARPDVVASPWSTKNVRYTVKAMVQTPLKKLKRRLIYGKVGY